MDVKGANPFLFGDDDYTSPNGAGNSNPFLMAADDCPDNTGNDNPFLSQTAATISSNVTSTNPFAFDPMDLGPSEAQMAEVGTNAFTTGQDTDIFAITNDFLPNAATVPEKPTDLNLKYTHTVADVTDKNSFMGGPPRPPPPRPPPSKETQDLLMSVMGAMDATSSHLLDKIPPTRTPSPVSMRDLHSPSPTPEPFADLLDVGPVPKAPSPAEDLMSMQHNACDINQNPPMTAQPSRVSPPKPVPPVRPPRPQQPPQKPPPPRAAPPLPPLVAAQTKPQQQVDEMMDMFGVEQKQGQKATASTADILSLYNAPVVTKPAVTDLLSDSVETTMTTEAVTSVTNAISASEPVALFENNVEEPDLPEVATTPIVQDNFVSPEPSQTDLQMDTSDSQSKDSVSSVTCNPFAAVEDSNTMTSPKQQDAFQKDTFAQEVFQQDTIQQDTFQLDAFQEEAPPQNAFQQNNSFRQEVFQKDTVLDNTAFQDTSLFGTNADTDTMVQNAAFQEQQVTIANVAPRISDMHQFADNQRTSDDFDAFAAKFESAKDENKNGFMAAFADVGDDAWGNQGNAFGDAGGGFNSGFGAEESFDAFLALQGPPAAPQSTPSRFDKVGSLDSDEDKDFSVVIRPKASEDHFGGALPVLAPPPAPIQNAFNDTSPRFNPFDQQAEYVANVPGIETALPFGKLLNSLCLSS